MENAILNFHFDFLHTSLIQNAFISAEPEKSCSQFGLLGQMMLVVK